MYFLFKNQKVVHHHSLFSEYDINLFKSGNHTRLYNKFGSHLMELNGKNGCYFSVFAPSAQRVEVIGDFNGWNGKNHALHVRWDSSGIWEGFIENVEQGCKYKYKIHSTIDDQWLDKTDPFAKLYEMPPKTASVVWHHSFEWNDEKWIEKRSFTDTYSSPILIYEMHFGSWKKKSGENRSFHYNEMVEELIPFLKKMNYTHVEFLPLNEHPFYQSWGYQCTGYFAPSSRFGNPSDLKYLVDRLHDAGIGVIMDWVPSHFPEDDFALAKFDGSCVYEHPDPKKGYHPDWKSLIFNYERNEVRSFLLSSARFWLDKFHVDGLRVDAVASMLYLDYSRDEGQWEPNIFGGNENLAAISFFKVLNTAMYADFPGIMMIAEESTSFKGVSTPVDMGGLGFGYKWMMGWMNDTLTYFSRDPIYRKYHQNEISFSMVYAYSENFVLPLSHDEVVHGKRSILNKMPGDEWSKFAHLRLLYAYMYAHPGHKLLFMGNDLGQSTEWNVDVSINWELLQFPPHRGLNVMISELNKIYIENEAFFTFNFKRSGFEWIDYADENQSIMVFLRRGKTQLMVVVCNFTPFAHNEYRIGMPKKGRYKVVFNSDEERYFGTGHYDEDEIITEELQWHSRSQSAKIRIPPLTVVMYEYQIEKGE